MLLSIYPHRATSNRSQISRGVCSESSFSDTSLAAAHCGCSIFPCYRAHFLFFHESPLKFTFVVQYILDFSLIHDLAVFIGNKIPVWTCSHMFLIPTVMSR